MYKTNYLSSISDLYFSDLTYTDIYVDGQIDGVRNLSLGQGVNFVIGENVRLFCSKILQLQSFKRAC